MFGLGPLRIKTSPLQFPAAILITHDQGGECYSLNHMLTMQRQIVQFRFGALQHAIRMDTDIQGYGPQRNEKFIVEAIAHHFFLLFIYIDKRTNKSLGLRILVLQFVFINNTFVIGKPCFSRIQRSILLWFFCRWLCQLPTNQTFFDFICGRIPNSKEERQTTKNGLS